MSQARNPVDNESNEDAVSGVVHTRAFMPASQRFERIVRDNLDFVWRSLRRCGVPAADVDDAVQQVFMVANDKLDLIQLGKERSFLFGVSSRVAAHARRAQARLESARERLSKNPLENPPDPEHLTQELQARDLLDQVLDAMPNEERAVFVLFELEELSVKEVAEMLEVPPPSVIQRLRRARVVFRRKAKHLRDLRRGGVL